MSHADEGLVAPVRPLDPGAVEAPSALRSRVAAALARHGAPAGDGAAGGAGDETARAAGCLAAGEALLDDVLAQPERARDAALDLLAADALVTFAFELLAAVPERLEAEAEAAMRRIARRDEAAAA